MAKRIEGTSSYAVLAVVAVATACSPERADHVAVARHALTTSNGLAQNGLTTNGLVANGMWTNGMWTNGMWTNGMWTNGVVPNGMWTNGMWTNGMWTNGMWTNGMWTNGVGTNGMWTNGMWTNGMWTNGLTGPAAVPGNTLRSSAYARQLLQYIYSCAMPAGTYDTTLDPNEGAPLLCASDVDCDVGYACSDGSCKIPLQGGGANGSGLGVNADGTTWWGSGTCDESCQRWVSACVLARTNAYGVHVQISMRAPSNAPQAVKDALAVDTDERASYPLREGAYYGNIFATTPSSTTLGPCTTLSDGTVTCEAVGRIVSTPQYTACAGPGSNIPQITKRFCSSQGDQVVIGVPGVCLATGAQSGICAGEDGNPGSPTFGAIRDCHTSSPTQPAASCSDYRDPTCYSEVLTVYLKQPIAVCGNAVCEDDGTATSPETAASCPSDCHAASWAKTFDNALLDDPNGQSTAPSRKVAVGSNGSIVIADIVCNAPSLDLDGDGNPATNALSGSPAYDLVLAKYDTTGAYQWGVRSHLSIFSSLATCSSGVGSLAAVALSTVSVAGDGSIVVAGYRQTSTDWLWVAKYTSNGALAAGWPVTVGGAAFIGALNAAVDGGGNVGVTGRYLHAGTFGSFSLPNPPTSAGQSYVAKIWSDGNAHTGSVPVAWAMPEPAGQSTALAFDPTGNVVVTFKAIPSYAELRKLSVTDGHQLGMVNYLTLSSSDANRATLPEAVATDSDGNVYVTGFRCLNGLTNCNVRLIKYASDDNLTYLWSVGTVSAAGPSSGSSGQYLALDAGRGDVLVGGTLNNADFGVGLFPTFNYPNVFVAAYTTQDTLDPGQNRLRWAKQVPLVLDSVLSGFAVDPQHHVVVGGTYSGSMQLDGELLVNSVPELTNHHNAFFGRFDSPLATDITSPSIGTGTDATGSPLLTVPLDIYVQATSAAGAVVFFMPPTAIDAGNAGTNVVCLPRPNTMFPITTKPVTCTASDPLGNQSTAMFTVTVVDTLPPVFSPSADVKVPATSASGANVSYSLPTAIDQVDAARPVSCTPAAGSPFPVGTTTVTCTASDTRNNASQTTFNVIVTATFGVPCTGPSDCAAGICVDGVCCNTAKACDPCNACNVPGSVGTCAPTSGGTCTDHNACTQNDTCQNGACVGGPAVTCSASDQCHLAGTCDPATGECSNPSAPDGTACTDGNACTRTDTCQAGTCAGTNPVTCSANDQCHLAGTCNPATGGCSNPPAPDGTACTDGNTCTAGDVCMAGACAAGGTVSCDDQNPCTVDSCSPVGGCVHTPGNAGTICRTADNACDSAEVCTGSSASCPASADKVAPALAAGTSQSIVGNCTGGPVIFAVPTLVNSSCEAATTVACTWSQSGSKGTCTKSGNGASVPGNRYGSFAITCIATDAGGNASAPVSFTVTVLQPLSVRIQPPLAGDNDTIDNVAKAGSTVPTKVALYACNTNVTKTASVIVKIGATYVSSGGSSSTQTIAACTDTPDTSGLMTLDGAYYRYNLSTKGLSVTAGIAAFYQENISVAYKSAPGVVVGSDTIQLDLK